MFVIYTASVRVHVCACRTLFIYLYIYVGPTQQMYRYLISVVPINFSINYACPGCVRAGGRAMRCGCGR